MSSSDSSKKIATEIAPAKLALNHYLAVMLEEATSWEEELEPGSAKPDVATPPRPIPPLSTASKPEPKAVEPEPKPAPAEPVVEKTIPEPPVARVTPEVKPAVAPVEPAPKEVAQPDDGEAAFNDEIHLAAQQPILAWEENGRPGWAQNRFDCLLFKVDGLALAVPMILLGTIYKIDSELTPLFGQPDWFLGLLRVHDGRNIRVVDTAQLVMPERYRAEAIDTLVYAIGIHDCDWAMGCHEVVGSITLTPDDVKWRSERTRRPWLAGTVVDHMCALIDLDAFETTLLAQRAKPRKTS